MTSAVGNFRDSLSNDEAEFVQAIMDELKGEAWAAPVLASIRDNGGITEVNKDRMFELRFGYAADRAGIVAQYEIPGEPMPALPHKPMTRPHGRPRVEQDRPEHRVLSLVG